VYGVPELDPLVIWLFGYFNGCGIGRMLRIASNIARSASKIFYGT